MPTSHRIALSGLLGFLVLMGVSALRYPGGSWADAHAPGFAPLTNYWCDLMRTVAWNGEPHRWALAAQVAFVSLASSGLACFVGVAPLLPEGAARRVALAGWASFAAVVGLAVVSYEEYRTAHAVFSLAAGAALTVSTVETILRSWPRVGAGVRWSGLLFLTMSAANIAVYIPLVLAGGGDSVSMPIIQKLATAALLLWMPLVLAAARRVGSRSP